MRLTSSSFLRFILAAVLVVSLTPAIGSSTSFAVEPTDATNEDTQPSTQDSAVTPGWTQCGECEYKITDDALTVRTITGNTGFLDYWTSSSPWSSEAIVSATFEHGVRAQTCAGLFNYCTSLTSVDLSNLDTSGVTNMKRMFGACQSLTSIDMSGLNTFSTTTMSDMFFNCASLSQLNLQGVNTSNVTDMSGMFSSCPMLSSLDLSGFSTSSVQDMNNMFSGCAALSSLDLSGFNTADVQDMSRMFCACHSLTSLDLSGFSTYNVTDMNSMFSICTNLSSLNLSGFDTYNVEDMDRMFSSCNSLRKFKLGSGYRACSIEGIPQTTSRSQWWSADLETPLSREAIFNRPNIADIYTAEQSPAAVVDRLSGQDSSETAAAIAQTTFPNGSEWVVLARADDFADAMSAAGLAGTLDAPIILTDRNTLSAAASDAIERLGATKCYIIGGFKAMPGDFEEQLEEMGLDQVDRLFGTEAWDTSVACANEIAQHKGNTRSDAIVAMSSNFQDALSISSFAYKYGVPIFLETSDTQGRVLPGKAISAIEDLDGTIYVAGGTGAVPESSVEDVFEASRVLRLWGNDGYDTSNQIASYMVDKGLLSPTTVCVACGALAAKGSDALAGAALAGKLNGPVLLVNSNTGMGVERLATLQGNDSKGTPAFLTKNAAAIAETHLLGGTYVVPETLEEKIRFILL